MSLGDRCDEIVRLIDETLMSVGATDDASATGTVTDIPDAATYPVVDTSAHPSGSALAGRGLRPSETLRPSESLRPSETLRLELVPALVPVVDGDQGADVVIGTDTARAVEMSVHRRRPRRPPTLV